MIALAIVLAVVFGILLELTIVLRERDVHEASGRYLDDLGHLIHEQRLPGESDRKYHKRLNKIIKETPL